MTRRAVFTAIAALAFALPLTACAATPEAQTSPPPTESAAPPAEPAVEETPTPEPTAAAEPTCETIIAPSTVTSLSEIGWTHQQREFQIGADVVDGGIQCVWGDYSVASDHVQVYGWAPLDQTASAAAQQTLIAEGWQRAEADGHTYITEDPQFSLQTDEEGFGMTYEFGEGWVALANTKQGLLLINQP
ncbi:hypothetical protein DC31_15475 [Microbacterium sp. CH12i]|uniref:hypothetical protein n=1 Tax=Microbacterium sp. CH12i TaxID=1479651 RepID=UPI000460C5EC|nr:hypothetical protein [Microbacterium sp. CH12i]KDA05790.1 hypothetical protein DC31_15475 [Microbacterium sp. CH12i]